MRCSLFKLHILTILTVAVLSGFSLADDMGIDISDNKDLKFSESWLSLSDNEESRVEKLIKILNNTASGKKILLSASTKAAEYGQILVDVIKEGSGSITDTTLVRKFSKEDPLVMVYETKSVVYINRNLNLINALLDLAHELTHYTFRESFNPYTSDFNIKKFINSTVEGRGGEVDAYLAECTVYKELSKKEFDNSKCKTVLDSSDELSKDLAIKQFYMVGEHYEWFMKKMEQAGHEDEFSEVVGKDHPSFISSAYDLPYPVAAIKEFEGIKSKVCANDEKRLEIMKSAIGRNPASEPDKVKTKYDQAKIDYEAKCAR